MMVKFACVAVLCMSGRARDAEARCQPVIGAGVGCVWHGRTVTPRTEAAPVVLSGHSQWAHGMAMGAGGVAAALIMMLAAADAT